MKTRSLFLFLVALPLFVKAQSNISKVQIKCDNSMNYIYKLSNELIVPNNDKKELSEKNTLLIKNKQLIAKKSDIRTYIDLKRNVSNINMIFRNIQGTVNT